MNRPYTTRNTNESYDLSLVDSGIGWKRTNGNAESSMKSLAKDMPKITENALFGRNDISVPSPWGVFVLFDIILKDCEGQFGDFNIDATNEWRALLTLIALRNVYGIDLKPEEIDMTISENDADKAFFENLLNLAPRKSLFGDSDSWSKFIFLSLDGDRIGAFSSLSLVVPCVEFQESHATRRLQELGFMDDTYKFVDPLEMLSDDLVMSIFMAKWLERVKREIPKIPSGDRIGSVIDDFIDDLCDAYSGDKVAYHDLFESDFLSFSYVGDGDRNPVNAFELLCNTNVDTFNLNSPQVIRMIKVKRLDQPTYILEQIGTKVVDLINMLGDKCLRPDGACWDNSSVFLDNIALVKHCGTDGEAFEDKFSPCEISDGEKIDKYSYILPIKEDVLESLKSYVLMDTVDIIQTNDTIKVTISFETENNNKCQLAKEYSINKAIKIMNSALPEVAVWPYAIVKRKDGENNENLWKDFYVFTAQNRDDKSYVVKIKSDDCIKNKEMTFMEMSRINDNGKMRSVANCTMLPTHMAVYKREYTYSGEIENEYNIGVIIFKKPEIVTEIDSDKKYTVGFDFGTTATTAFCMRCNDQMGIDKSQRFIKFGQKIDSRSDGIYHRESIKIASDNEKEIGDDNDGCYIIYKNFDVQNNWYEPCLSFVPGEYVNKLFYPSLYKLNTERVELDDEYSSLKYGNIFFDQRYLPIAGNSVNRNIKWGRNINEQLAMKCYLSQMMKAITFTLAKERVGQIKWRISYPTSLSKKALKTYKDTTYEIIRKLNDISGVNSSLDERITPYVSESIASAKFQKINSGHYICIDIGGGSTDVSMWKQNLSGAAMKCIMQFSIGMASRKIFIAGLADAIINPRDEHKSRDCVSRCAGNEIQTRICKILEKNSIDKDDSEKFHDVIRTIKDSKELNSKEVSRKMDEFKIGVVEPLLQSDGEIIKKIIRSEPKIERYFYKFLLAGFWGILYYTALSASTFKKQLEDTRDIKILLAGNGSLMYDWIQDMYLSEDIEKAFEFVLNKKLERSDSDKIRVKLEFTKNDLKTEAARGLLDMDDQTDIDIPSNTNGLIIGAETDIRFRDGTNCLLGRNTVITDQEHEYYSEYFGNAKKSNIDSMAPISPKSDLTEYINTMNDYIIDDEDKEDRYVWDDKIDDNIRDRIYDALNESSESGIVAPMFVLELEAFLRTMLEY